MKVKRFSETEITAILGEADRDGDDDATCRKYNVSQHTMQRWRAKYLADPDDCNGDSHQRIAQLEAENTRLKRLLAKQAVDIAMLRGTRGRRV